MVDGANAGREKQPFRRVQAEPGIEDHRARHRQWMAQRLLDLGLLVGDAGGRGKLAAGNRRRHADLAHGGGLELRRSAAAGADAIDVVGVTDVVGEAKLDSLGAIGDRAAADGHDQVGIGGAGLFGRGNHCRARRMRRHRVKSADAARPQLAADLLDLVGLAVQRPADHQERALRAQSVQLFQNRPGCRPPEHDLIHRAEYDTTFMHLCPPRTLMALVAGPWD